MARAKPKKAPSVTLDSLIEELELSTRSWNVLKHAKIKTLRELTALKKSELARLHGMGRVSVDEIISSLKDSNFAMAPEQPLREPVRSPRQPIPREPVVMHEPTVLPAVAKDISKKVDQLIADIRKDFGPDSIGRLGEYDTNVETFPSGSAQLDDAIGVGGFPLAKLVQITGGESAGKSTLCNYVAAQAQRCGSVVYFLDGEQSEGNDRASAIGVNTNLLPISEPETLEDAFSRMERAIERMKKWDTPSLIMLDSVAALPLRVDMTRGYDEESRRAARAAFLSANLAKLIAPLKGTKVGLIFVNQVREKANVTNPFEKKTYSPGGRALRHYCHLTLDVTRFGTVKDGQTAIGITSRIRVEKSKLAPPFKTAMLNLFFDGRVEDTTERHRGDD